MNDFLKIGYDGKRALFNNTGLGNYSRYVVDVMATALPGSVLTLYSQRTGERLARSGWSMPPNVVVEGPEAGWSRHVKGLWRHYGGLTAQLRRDRPALYHGLSNELPFDIRRAEIPTVVTVHDLIFNRFPDNYKAIDRKLYNFKFGAAARNATRIVAISERTKADIIEDFGIPAEKIDIIYQGCNPIFNSAEADMRRDEVRKKYNLTRPYVIMVGTVEQRKNQIMAVEALSMLPEEITLVIIGRHRNNYGKRLTRRVADLGLSDRVVFPGYVATEDLPALYADAVCAAYPSHYEGFGLPVIEAINSGTPVVAATGSCLEEAGGPGALYVDPCSPEEMAAAVLQICDSDDFRAKMVADGQAYTRRFSPAAFASQMISTYQKAIDQFNKDNN